MVAPISNAKIGQIRLKQKTDNIETGQTNNKHIDRGISQQKIKGNENRGQY